MDEHHYEQAERLAEAEREHALAAHRSRQQHAAQAAPTSICADCAEPIEPRRLHALPHARRCRECQADHESRR